MWESGKLYGSIQKGNESWMTGAFSSPDTDGHGLETKRHLQPDKYEPYKESCLMP
jgi:hypothetical protein